MVENYLAMDALNVLALLILSCMILQNDGIDKDQKRNHLWANLSTAAVVMADVGTVLFEGAVVDSRLMYIFCNAIGFALTPVIPILLASVFGFEKVRYLALILLPGYLNALFSLLSPFFGLIFIVSSSGAYQRGSLFAFFIAAYVWGALVCFKEILDTGKRYRYHLQAKLLAVFVFFLLGTTIQIVLPKVHTTWTCVTLALALHYGFVCELSNTLDPLTKLYNRKAYDSELERLSKRKRFAVIVMDVDNFKQVNDRFGHPCGDQCLTRLASMVKASFYRIGTSYRIGGDEFCVLCKTADEEKVSAAIKLLMRKIEASRAVNPLLPRLSYGWQIYGGRGESVSQVVQAADRQMYQNKALHKSADSVTPPERDG